MLGISATLVLSGLSAFGNLWNKRLLYLLQCSWFLHEQQQDSSHPTQGTVSNHKADGCELLLTYYRPVSLPLVSYPWLLSPLLPLLPAPAVTPHTSSPRDWVAQCTRRWLPVPSPVPLLPVPCWKSNACPHAWGFPCNTPSKLWLSRITVINGKVCPVRTFAIRDSPPPINPARDRLTLLGEDLTEERFFSEINPPNLLLWEQLPQGSFQAVMVGSGDFTVLFYARVQCTWVILGISHRVIPRDGFGFGFCLVNFKGCLDNVQEGIYAVF